MSNLQPPDKVIAIFASDLHLAQRCPPARAGESDWFRAMERPLGQIRALAAEHDAPLVYAGDIWDHYRQPPEVINWAINNLPKGWAIPGQHDLAHHNYEDIRKSAYWTLVAANVIWHMGVTPQQIKPGLWMHPFPWGREVVRCDYDIRAIHIAVIHSYIWAPGHNYPGAPQEKLTTAWQARLAGYAGAVFGDNHRGFQRGNIVNCGTLMRRRSDEIDYRPAVALLYGDGRLVRYELDCSEDKIERVDEGAELLAHTLGMDHFLNELVAAGDTMLDYPEAIRRHLRDNNYPARVVALLLEALENNGNRPGTV